MEPGTVIAQRFEIEREAGSGGSSAVYRAVDRLTGEPVALKVMRSGLEPERFAREARAIARLEHPGIVRYVAHGTTGAGQHYLAMEWLAGEDLNQRLIRTGLTVRESVRVALHAAEALAVAHEAGVVHRDIKPSNLFLPDGELERVKVIDFGLARLSRFATSLTAAGNVLGTPGYFAPEQAQGSKTIDARADVFSLGCVLFKCLTGRRAFEGEDMIAVVAKVVLEAAPRVRDLTPDVPAPLDELIARMLSKDAVGRPADARAVADALGALADLDEGRRAPAAQGPPRLTGTEQRLVSVVVAARAVSGAGRDDATYPDRVPEGEATLDEKLAPGVASTETLLRDAVGVHGARVVVLFDGSAVATVTGAGSATDLAARAARCALAMRGVVPHSSMGLATGRGLLADLPVGEVIDRATELARELRRAQADPAPPSRRPAEPSPIRLDEVTAALLEGRFLLGGDARCRELIGAGDPAQGSRTLLGKPTPCVGRDRELQSLEAVFDECVSEPVSRVVLVTGVAGVGKTRLRHELVQRLPLRAGSDRLAIWESGGDPMSAGSPFSMVAPAIRRAAGIQGGEPLALRQQKLASYLEVRVPAKDLRRVVDFVGELAAVPSAHESIQLRAARQDPLLMGDQIRRAWEDLLAAECARGPLLLVLEDLHWGDLPSVRLIDAALRNLRDRPLMVVALGRPEVHDQFPMLWADRGLQEQRLNELTPKACERLVRVVLGEDVPKELCDRLLAQAMGNAFYLEELIRAVADRKAGALPETVLAMVHARLERLSPDARRILRAASVFGGVFWLGGVRALLGVGDHLDLADSLSDLCEREFITPRADPVFPGETEYAFRHTLVREAAYAMLTDGDRALGHRLAAGWLELAGETEPVVLAEHFERGGEPASAVGWYRLAAEQSLEGNDLDAALERAARGVACGATGEELGALLLAQAEAHRWQGRPGDAERTGLAAMSWLERGSPLWFNAGGRVANARGLLGRSADLEDVALELFGEPPRDDAASAQIVAVAQATSRLLFSGRYEVCERLLPWLRARAKSESEDATVAAWVNRALAIGATLAGDPGARLDLWAAAAQSFELVGDLRNACMQRINLGESYAYVGAYREAEETLRAALAASERLGMDTLIASAKQQLGAVIGQGTALDEARVIETESVELLRKTDSPRMEGMSRVRLAHIHLAASDLDAAEREAERACEILRIAPPARVHALATLARVLLARRGAAASARALEAVTEAMGVLRSLGHVDEGESLVRLVHAEALRAAGDQAGAAAAIASARRHLVQRADTIAEPALRQSFLECVPENAATLALAAEWADEMEGPPSSAGARRRTA